MSNSKKEKKKLLLVLTPLPLVVDFFFSLLVAYICEI